MAVKGYFKRLARAGLTALCLTTAVAPLAFTHEVIYAQNDASGAFEHSVKARLVARSLLLDVAKAADRIVLVGERGHILVASDSVDTWRQLDVPSRATLTGVYFHDKDLGWVVGHDAVILRTKNGGETWERVYYAPHEERPLLDVWFRNAKHGFALGAYGYFLETKDGGDTWNSRTLNEEEDLHLNHIAKSATGRLYIAAEAGTVYRSDDHGKTWVALRTPYEGSFYGTLPLEKDTVLTFGVEGKVFRSADAGENWREVATPTSAILMDGMVTSAGDVIMVGSAGVLLTSGDRGRSFVLRQQTDRKGMAAVLAPSDRTLILVGEAGVKTLSAIELHANSGP